MMGRRSEHGAQSRKRKRVSLTTMPMQSKAQQQHMNEKKDAMQRNESAAATILTKNEARSKRYYARIEAGARELRRAEKEKEAAREVVDAGGGRAAEALEAARVVGSDSCAIVSAGGRVCAAGVEVGCVPPAASVVVRGEVYDGALVACAAGEAGEVGAGAKETPTTICGQKERCQELSDKKGTMRPTNVIGGLMPPGAVGMKTKVPKRIDFGAEGAEGDAAHEAKMNEFSIVGFGSEHAEDRTIDAVSMHVAFSCR